MRCTSQWSEVNRHVDDGVSRHVEGWVHRQLAVTVYMQLTDRVYMQLAVTMFRQLLVEVCRHVYYRGGTNFLEDGRCVLRDSEFFLAKSSISGRKGESRRETSCGAEDHSRV